MPEVPLHEAREAYRLQIRREGLLLREKVVTEPRWLYGAAEQLADGLTGPWSVEVAQISDRYGPGLAARLDLLG